jgi:hypothetical protein
MARRKGRTVRERSTRMRAARRRQAILRLAGTVSGPRDLSSRTGFSRRASVGRKSG